jgi:hypothetical protein
MFGGETALRRHCGVFCSSNIARRYDERAHLVIFMEADKTRQDTSRATLALAA